MFKIMHIWKIRYSNYVWQPCVSVTVGKAIKEFSDVASNRSYKTELNDLQSDNYYYAVRVQCYFSYTSHGSGRTTLHTETCRAWMDTVYMSVASVTISINMCNAITVLVVVSN